MSKFGVVLNTKSTSRSSAGNNMAASDTKAATGSSSSSSTTAGPELTVDCHATGSATAVSEIPCNGDKESTPHSSLPTSPTCPMSPTSHGAAAAGTQDSGRNVAIDYMKARYESGKSKEAPSAANVPKVLREPRKLDFQWDKIVDDNAKKETGVPVGFKEQDLLQMVFMCMGVDTKSQYLSAIDAEKQPSKDERQLAEIEALPEITRSVRSLFESGKITERNVDDATKKDRVNDPLPEWGVYESKPSPQLDGVVRAVDREPDEIQRGLTSALLGQWTRIGMDDAAKSQSPAAAAAASFRPTYADYDFSQGSGIFENEPVVIDGVVRSSDNLREERVKRGLTKSLLGQWNSIGKEDIQPPGKSAVPPQPRTGKSTYEAVPGSGVFENEPVKIEGVVRASDVPAEGEQIQRGMTRSLLSQWQNKGNEQPRTPTKRIIRIVEDEGTVAENEPVRRTDVVRAEDNGNDEDRVIQRGMARALVSEWKVKGSEEFRAERKSINVAEAEGRVAENDPVKRSDVVREDDASVTDVGEQIQRGTTRMLLNQWKSIGSSQSSKERTPIIIAEADGRIVENDPVKRQDVVREEDSGFIEELPVQRGLTKSLLQQWKTMGTDETVRKDKTPVVLDEAEGRVLENEPIRRMDVVHSDDYVEDRVQVQRGITKSLLSQWKTKGTEEFRPEKRPIVLDEDDGTVAENEPVRRSDVTREEDSLPAEQEHVKRGTTRGLLSQWKNKATEEFKVEKKPIVLAEADDCVCENEPVKRTDVINAEVVEVAPVQRGMTKSLLNQWKNKSTEEFKVDRKPIVVAEGEGQVVESEPTRRDDVVRSDDVDLAGEQVQKGITRNLREQWMTKGSEKFHKEKTPINVAEGEGKILENEPIRRDDVVHADDIDTEGEQVQRGMTRNLREHWKKKSSEEFRKEKTPIILAEGEGKILENEPVRRDDVVHADDVITEGEFVQKGIAKSLMTRWSNPHGDDDDASRAQSRRQPIIIAEDEGRVAESEPIRRSDVVHADDILSSAEDGGVVVQKGMTRSLLTQWKSKGTEDFKVERKPINVAEAEGQVVENEPAPRRDDVIRCDDETGGEAVVRGLTRNMVSQWAVKGTEEYVTPRKVINVAEAEGTVAENEPVVRDDVVRADDPSTDAGEQVRRGIARSLADQWKHKGDEQFQVERKPIVLAEAEGRVLESEPVRRTDVIHADDVLTEGEVIRRGTTKTLLSQWKTKGTEEFKPQRKSIIIEDAEGKVAENEPVVRTDVVRENIDADFLAAKSELPARGQAKQLRAQWMSKGDDTMASNQRPEQIKLYEPDDLAVTGEPFVVENSPQPRRTDVVREDDITEEEIALRAGYARDMAGYWSAGPQSCPEPRGSGEKKLDLADGVVAENNPVRLDGVVRADDPLVDDGLNIERGLARQLASQWLNRSDDAARSKEPFHMELDINPNDVAVYENDPVQLAESVIKCSEPISDIVGQRGQIRNIRMKYVSAAASSASPDQSDTPRKIVLDMADGPTVVENDPQPVDPSVVRSTWSLVDETTPQAGLTRSLLERWKSQQDLESPASSIGGGGGGGVKPAWMIEMEMTPAGSGVFENCPVVRTDVIREEDREPEMIPIRQTRRTRALWSRLEKEDAEAGSQQYVQHKPPPELIRFTPPRERSPPTVGQQQEGGGYTSVQSIQLKQTTSTILPITSAKPPAAATSSSTGASSRRHHHQQQQQQQQQQQPSTPGGSTSSQFTWIPSATETAQTRAKIGSEVLQWHASRSSRSVSLDDASGPLSPGSGGEHPSAAAAGEHPSDWVWQAAQTGQDLFHQGPADDVDAAVAPPTMKSSAVLVFKSTSTGN